jgi:hypothetical protein
MEPRPSLRATTNIVINGSVSINTIHFTASAPAYSIGTGEFGGLCFGACGGIISIVGTGVVNDSANVQFFSNRGETIFKNGSTAGNLHILNLATMTFGGSSTAGSATITSFGGQPGTRSFSSQTTRTVGKRASSRTTLLWWIFPCRGGRRATLN